jgi:hypothetical protein
MFQKLFLAAPRLNNILGGKVGDNKTVRTSPALLAHKVPACLLLPVATTFETGLLAPHRWLGRVNGIKVKAIEVDGGEEELEVEEDNDADDWLGTISSLRKPQMIGWVQYHH